jgi:hypothetical protein
MRNKKQYSPEFEKLESIALLSGLPAQPHGLVSPITADALPAIMSASSQVKLNGSFHGDYHVSPGIPDVGQTYTFFGHGDLKREGKADVSGSVHQLGFVATGKVHGLLVISTPQGSLTLTLTGPTQKGFAALPERFSFKITNSSGAYLHERGHGTAILVLDPASAGADHGSFTLALVS